MRLCHQSSCMCKVILGKVACCTALLMLLLVTRQETQARPVPASSRFDRTVAMQRQGGIICWKYVQNQVRFVHSAACRSAAGSFDRSAPRHASVCGMPLARLYSGCGGPGAGAVGKSM